MKNSAFFSLKTTLVTILVIGLFFSVSVLGLEETKEGLTKITMVFPRSIEVLDDAQVHAADKLGYFEEEGIDIEVKQSYGTTDVKMVASGNAEIAYPSPWVQMAAHNSRLPIISIFDSDIRNIFEFGVRRDSDIYSIKDLKGKSISIGDPFWKTIANPALRAAGISPDEVEYVVAGNNRAQVVSQGKVDAVLTWEKEHQLFWAQGMDFRILDFENFLKNDSNSIVTSLSMVKNHPETLKAFLRGYTKGLYFTLLNPAASTQITLERFPSIKVEFSDALKAITALAYIDHDEHVFRYGYGWHDPAKWYISVEESVIGGLLSEPIALEKVFTNQFIPAANEIDFEAAERDAKNFKLKPEYQEQMAEIEYSERYLNLKKMNEEIKRVIPVPEQ